MSRELAFLVYCMESGTVILRDSPVRMWQGSLMNMVFTDIL